MNPEQLAFPIPEQPAVDFSAVILVRYDDNDFDHPYVLASQRMTSDTYTFPGGKIEAGQSAAETAIVELREETGLIIDPEMLIRIPEPAPPFVSGGTVWQGTYYFAFMDECFPDTLPLLNEPDKHRGWTWLPIREVLGYANTGGFPWSAIGPSWFSEFTENARNAEFPEPNNVFPATHQSMGVLPCSTRYALALENGRDPKNPL